VLLNKLARKNYFVALLILLGITTLAVVTAFTLTALIPDALGRNPYHYEITSVCEFEPWKIEVDGLNINLPSGGIIATVNRTDRKRGVIILGEGIYQQDGEDLADKQVGGIFLTLENSLFEEIRGGNIFVPVENNVLLGEISAIAEKQVGIPPIWDDTIPLSFHSRQNGLVYYYFLTPDGKPILPPEAITTDTGLGGTFIVYSLFIIIMILVITIFSLEHRYSNHWIHLRKTPVSSISIILVPVTAATIFIAEYVDFKLPWGDDYSQGIGYIVIIVFLILMHRIGIIDRLDFGLRRERILHGYFLALISAILIIGAIRGLPEGLSFNGLSAAIRFPLMFLFIGLPREMIWRGYIQTILSRKTGANKGLILTMVIAAVIRLAAVFINTPWMLYYPYIYLDILILAPGIAAILGYVYLRTENIMAPALIYSLIVFLPDYILY